MAGKISHLRCKAAVSLFYRLASGFHTPASHALVSLQMVPYMAASTADKSYDGLGLMSTASESLYSMMTDNSSHMLAKCNLHPNKMKKVTI